VFFITEQKANGPPQLQSSQDPSEFNDSSGAKDALSKNLRRDIRSFWLIFTLALPLILSKDPGDFRARLKARVLYFDT
jgi:hypothetical protein